MNLVRIVKFFDHVRKALSKLFGFKKNNIQINKTIEHKIVLQEVNHNDDDASGVVKKTIGELQSEPMSAWGASAINGLKFHATMQIRTPLRVLTRHGETHTDINTAPPKIAINGWEGIWVPKSRLTKILKGTDLELPEDKCASDAGLVIVDEYLPYLIAVRRIIETYEPIEDRITKLRNMPAKDIWEKFWYKGKSAEVIAGNHFPYFVSTIPNIGYETKDILFSLKLDTPNRIAAATDETLLSIKGIGSAKLKIIRHYCAGINENRDALRLDMVER